MQIFTIGYERATLANVIRVLQDSHITEVVDIRQRASSRRRGFSKTALSAALREAGIDYRHVRALGTPVALRRELALDRNYPRFFSHFATYLGSRTLEVEQLARDAEQRASTRGRMALLCFERDPACCHRSIVATALAKLTAASVTNLSAPVEAG